MSNIKLAPSAVAHYTRTFKKSEYKKARNFITQSQGEQYTMDSVGRVLMSKKVSTKAKFYFDCAISEESGRRLYVKAWKGHPVALKDFDRLFCFGDKVFLVRGDEAVYCFKYQKYNLVESSVIPYKIKDLVLSDHVIYRFFERFQKTSFESLSQYMGEIGWNDIDQERTEHFFANIMRGSNFSYPKMLKIVDNAMQHRVYPTKEQLIKYKLKNKNFEATTFHRYKKEIVFVVRDNVVVTCYPFNERDFGKYPHDAFEGTDMRKINTFD